MNFVGEQLSLRRVRESPISPPSPPSDLLFFQRREGEREGASANRGRLTGTFRFVSSREEKASILLQK